jgi:protein TonB
MLAYAPRRERHRIRPSALVLVVAVHAAAIVAVMSARMELPEPVREPPLVLDPVPLPPDPQPLPPEPRQPNRSSQIDVVEPVVPPMPSPGPTADPLPTPMPFPGPIAGEGNNPFPPPVPGPPLARTGPRFITPDHALKPPYPEEKRRLEQEATLKLRLSIDERGRVVAVEPVGRADLAFLDAARRHILKAWRYKPATEGGKAIASSTVITLQFELN